MVKLKKYAFDGSVLTYSPPMIFKERFSLEIDSVSA